MQSHLLLKKRRKSSEMGESFTANQIKQLREVLQSEIRLEIQREFGKLENTLLQRIETVVTERTERISCELSELKSEHSRARAKILQLETTAMRNGIEVVKFPKEPLLKTDEIIIRISKTINFKMAESDIVRTAWVGKVKKIDKIDCQNITVTFYDPKLAAGFMEAVKRFTKSSEGLKANEICSRCAPVVVRVFRQLPQEVKKLKWLASKKKDALKYAYCWVSSTGKLLMKKSEEDIPIWIQSEEDLLKLK